MLPIGDKVVLREVPESEATTGGIIVPSTGGEILAEVISVGEGIPFGRGEFYPNTLREGNLVFVTRKDWEGAPILRLRRGKDRPEMFRVVHERQVLVCVDREEL